MAALRPANRAVKRQQKNHARQRLGPLNNVRHRLRLQRMHRPQQGAGERQARGPSLLRFGGCGQQQRLTNDAEQA